MFGGWFSRSRSAIPPIEPVAMEWMREQIAWLQQEFGEHRLRDHPVVEPTDQFFPDHYDGTPAAAEAMFGRICRLMDIEPTSVRLQFVRQPTAPGLVNRSGHDLPMTFAGLYAHDGELCTISLEEAELLRPLDIVGTMAHELAHVRLLGEGRTDGDEFDNELLTDLTAIFFGFGIFLANSPRAWPSEVGTWPGTDVVRPEYMSLPMITFALALIAHLRGETKPAWPRHLGSPARAEFAVARRFLLDADASSERG